MDLVIENFKMDYERIHNNIDNLVKEIDEKRVILDTILDNIIKPNEYSKLEIRNLEYSINELTLKVHLNLNELEMLRIKEKKML
jgi:hypothetical protein